MRRLQRSTKVGYGVGSVGTGIYSTVPGLLLLTFMIDTLGIRAGIAGVVLLLPRLWDVVTDPFLGGLSDRTRSRLGPRRPWLLGGGLALPLCFALLFAPPEAVRGEPALALYVLALYVLAATAFTAFQVPYVAMPAEITRDYDERTSLLSYRIAFLTVGILVAGAGAPELVALAVDPRRGYALMGLTLGAVMLTACLGAFWGTRRAPVVQAVAHAVGFREQLATARQNGPYFRILACFFVQALGVSISLAGVAFFTASVLERPGALSVLFVALILPSLLSMPAWNAVSRRIGKRACWIACSALYAIGSLLLLSAGAGMVGLAAAFALIIGLGYAGTQLFPFAMLPDTITADEARTGLQRAGAFTGLWTAGEKAGFAIGPALFSFVLAIGGYQESVGGVVPDQPDSAVLAIRFGFAVLPALLVGAGLVFLRGYELDEATVNRLAAEVEERGDRADQDVPPDRPIHDEVPDRDPA